MESSNGRAINTFTKGMNKDIDYSVMPKEAYLDAQNFRLITNQGSSSGSLEVIEGNSLIDSHTPSDHTIIGYCNVREDMIIFSTSPQIPSEIIDGAEIIGYYLAYSCRIAKVTVVNGVFTNYTVLYDDVSDETNYLLQHLNFHVDFKIKAIGRYETETIQTL